jgi:hypothetical protein
MKYVILIMVALAFTGCEGNYGQGNPFASAGQYESNS